jgi:hypothetical protein
MEPPGAISFALPNVEAKPDDVTSIIMFDWKTGKSQVIAKTA